MIRPPGPRALLVTCLAFAATSTAPSSAAQQAPAAEPLTPRFIDVTAEMGIEFRHHHGGMGDKQLPETMGSGLAWLDYDRDGRWDLYLIDSGPLPASLDGSPLPAWTGEGERPPGANALYRGLAGSFSLEPQSGTGDRGYGQGVSVADYDGDGFPDIYVTNLGRNALYRNNGDGTFTDVTEAAGVGGGAWSVSSAWGDLDGDGLPELYVANYLEYDLANPLLCGDPGSGSRSYCHISLFDGAADVLYRNNGDGTFADISAAAGLGGGEPGKGLGVVIGHVDDDDALDIYVANDSTQNFLYSSHGSSSASDGRRDLAFEEVGLVAGVGFGSDGRPQAGMGVDLADLDADGRFEIVVSNFDVEPVNLYRAVAPGLYLDDSFPLGIGAPTLRTLGFGLGIEDFDGDGDLDIVVANGHILDDVAEKKDSATYPQPNQLLVNDLGRWRSANPDGSRPHRDLFSEATAGAGDALAAPRVSRGLASADFDGDGRPDLAVVNSQDQAQLLRNDTGDANQRMVLRLTGRQSPRDAAGARVYVFPEGAPPLGVRAVRNGSSYASQHAADVHLGLGGASAARIEIVWPDGRREVLERLAAGSLYLLTQGRGITASEPLRPR